MDDAEHADRPAPAGGRARGLPHLRADRHRPASQRKPGHQHHSALGNIEETITVQGATPLVDVRSAGISESSSRSGSWSCRCRDARSPISSCSRAGRSTPAGFRRSARATAWRSRWPADCATASSISSTGPRTTARTISATCRSPSRTRCRNSAWPAAGCRGDRHALVGSGQCGHQVRHQQVSRERVRVLPRRSVQRSGVFRAGGS